MKEAAVVLDANGIDFPKFQSAHGNVTPAGHFQEFKAFVAGYVCEMACTPCVALDTHLKEIVQSFKPIQTPSPSAQSDPSPLPISNSDTTPNALVPVQDAKSSTILGLPYSTYALHLLVGGDALVCDHSDILELCSQTAHPSNSFLHAIRRGQD